jgi:hypothetical protein
VEVADPLCIGSSGNRTYALPAYQFDSGGMADLASLVSSAPNAPTFHFEAIPERPQPGLLAQSASMPSGTSPDGGGSC